MFDSFLPTLTRLVSFLEKLHQRLPPALRTFTFMFIGLPLFALALVVIKAIAIVRTLISAPRETLFAIPANWRRIALATDHRYPPEFLSGVETDPEAPSSAQAFKYHEIRRRITSGTSRPFFQKLSLFAICAPTILYRLFLKSTGLIYFPFIWVSHVPLTPNGILNLPLERVRRWYASAAFLLLLSPLVISFYLQHTLATPQDRILFTYLIPVNGIDWWHVARLVAVGTTFVLYFYARQPDANNVQNPERARSIIMRANQLRAACGIITIASFFLILLAL